MKKRVFVLVLFTFLVNLLSGCVSGSGLLVGDQTAADEYMTNNPQLIEKYGADYTFVLTGGGGGGEINSAGKSGEMSFDYPVNQTDTYTVSLGKNKRESWKVEGLILTSCDYTCDELSFSFSERSSGDYYDVANGDLCFRDITIPVLVSLGFHRLNVENAELKNQYNEEWAAVSEGLMGAAEKDWEELEKWSAREAACTLFVCDIESNFDEFTATVQPRYQDYLGSELTVLHFHAVE